MAHTRIPEQHEYQHLGAYLRDLRLHFRLDVAEVARRTHIRAKYIQAIEDEQPDLLPGRVYARGYVVTYAEFFGLAAEEFANLYMAQLSGGQPQVGREPVYFVPEPKRQQIARKGGMAWMYGVGLLAAMAAGGYFLAREDQLPAQNVVMDVPERLVEQLRNVVMPVAGNAECLLGESRFGCMQVRKAPAVPDFMKLPSILYVERDVVVADETDKAAKEDEASTTPASDSKEEKSAKTPEPVKSEEKPAEKPAVAKTPEAAKPQAKPEKKPDTPKGKEDVKKKQDDAVNAQPAPFRRQGEETTPAPVVQAMAEEVKTASQTVKAEPETTIRAPEVKPEKTLPSRWSDTGAPEGYSDPNAAPKEPWSPRRSR